jgi:hypothetical protein
VQLGKGEDLAHPIWQRVTYATSMALPRALLVPKTTYAWRVVAWSWAGSAVSPTFHFTTQGVVEVPDGGADGGLDAAADAGPDGSICGPVTCSGIDGGLTCGCYQVYMNTDYSVNCSDGLCTCFPVRDGGTADGGPVRFIDNQACSSAARLQAEYFQYCGCP